MAKKKVAKKKAVKVTKKATKVAKAKKLPKLACDAATVRFIKKVRRLDEKDDLGNHVQRAAVQAIQAWAASHNVTLSEVDALRAFTILFKLDKTGVFTGRDEIISVGQWHKQAAEMKKKREAKHK